MPTRKQARAAGRRAAGRQRVQAVLVVLAEVLVVLAEVLVVLAEVLVVLAEVRVVLVAPEALVRGARVPAVLLVPVVPVEGKPEARVRVPVLLRAAAPLMRRPRLKRRRPLLRWMPQP